jgi:alcohol dehydrogenase YqhD (iron-dependent ADH family)
MQFEFANPTKIVFFGAGSLERLGKIAGEYGKHALLVKRSGVFDKAVSSLKAAGVAVSECSDIDPNPRASAYEQ